MTLTCFDSVSIEHIPSGATIVAGYVNGIWPTYNELVVRFPHAHHISIAVTSGFVADVLDVERGDATPQDAPRWAKEMRLLHKKPVIYCSASVIPSVRGQFDRAGEAEPFFWAADWTNKPHLYPGTVATQWADGTTPYLGLARYTDTSSISPNFPGLYSPMPSLQKLAQAKLVELPNPAQAKIAIDNGWPLRNWNGHAFVPAVNGAGKEYTNLHYEYKRP